MNNSDANDAAALVPISPPRDGSIQLGPCRVCGATSSGYHFGVISCEACKSFFRRTLKLNLSYTCLHGEEVKTTLRQVKGEKPPCPSCRFNKCVESGMHVQAIKRGRYSHARKVETYLNAQKRSLEESSSTSPATSPVTSEAQGSESQGFLTSPPTTAQRHLVYLSNHLSSAAQQQSALPQGQYSTGNGQGQGRRWSEGQLSSAHAQQHTAAVHARSQQALQTLQTQDHGGLDFPHAAAFIPPQHLYKRRRVTATSTQSRADANVIPDVPRDQVTYGVTSYRSPYVVAGTRVCTAANRSRSASCVYPDVFVTALHPAFPNREIYNRGVQPSGSSSRSHSDCHHPHPHSHQQNTGGILSDTHSVIPYPGAHSSHGDLTLCGAALGNVTILKVPGEKRGEVPVAQQPAFWGSKRGNSPEVGPLNLSTASLSSGLSDPHFIQAPSRVVASRQRGVTITTPRGEGMTSGALSSSLQQQRFVFSTAAGPFVTPSGLRHVTQNEEMMSLQNSAVVDTVLVTSPLSTKGAQQQEQQQQQRHVSTSLTERALVSRRQQQDIVSLQCSTQDVRTQDVGLSHTPRTVRPDTATIFTPTLSEVMPSHPRHSSQYVVFGGSHRPLRAVVPTHRASSGTHLAIRPVTPAAFSRSGTHNPTSPERVLLRKLLTLPDVESGIKTICRAFDKQNFTPIGFFPKIPSAINKYLLKEQKVYPKVKPMTKTEHRDIFVATGLDADDRLCDVFLKHCSIYEDYVRKVSPFLRKIPGFSSLAFDDRAAIVKFVCGPGRGHAVTISAYRVMRLTDAGEDVCVAPWNGDAYIITQDAARQIHSDQLVERLFKAFRIWTNLSLTRHEEAIFLAVLLVSEPEYVSDEGKKKCAVMRSFYMQCLRTVLATRLRPSRIERVLHKLHSLNIVFVRLCRDLTEESNEFGRVYQSFFAKELKLIHEIIQT